MTELTQVNSDESGSEEKEVIRPFSSEFEDFLQLVSQNDWMSVLIRLRSSRTFGLNPAMQEDKELLEMPSFTRDNLEKRNGTDCLNAVDEYGRSAL